MRNAALALLTVSTLAASAADAKKKPDEAWQVSRTSDPITGATSCVVTATDRTAGIRFTQSGALYPFVENNSTHGLLVGVSSGGRFRLPTGDIVWRVDDRPFRTLHAADNPAGTGPAIPAQAEGQMQKLVEEQRRLIAAATATSTVASGATARAMLAELLAGHALIFRSAAATPEFGLPNGATQSVGQITKDGLKPYPVDDSFRAGLAACGIDAATAGLVRSG